MIERGDVLRIAELARLELSDQEVERMAVELSKIVDYMAQLARVAESAPEAAEEAATPQRQDRVVPSRDEELLAAAPEREDGLVRVPRVVE